MKMLPIFCMSIFFSILSVQAMEKESDSLVEKLTEIYPHCFEQEEDIVILIEKGIAQGYIDVNDLEIAQRQRRELTGIVGPLTSLVELVLKLEELVQQETSSESEDLGALLLAEKHKDAFLITQLPEESFLIANQSLANSIKILMKLSMLSKDFNNEWTTEKIGALCKNYSDDNRCEMIGWLFAYRIRPCLYKPLAILLHAGLGKYTDEYSEFVLEKVTGKAGFLPVVQLLFKNKANPNVKIDDNNYPLVFKVKTVEEAQLFVDNGVNLHEISTYYQSNWRINVLWCTVQEGYPSELMKFYLDQKVNPRNVNHRGQCLLHELVNLFCLAKDMDDYFKKFELLLDAIPDMINLCGQCQTPTGWLMQVAKEDGEEGYKRHSKETYEKFIALFRNHGGRTQIELQPWYREGVNNKI